MIELEHSPLGGSSAHRFMSCIAAFLLHREQLMTGTFEDIVSDFAELGTGAHEVAALAVSTRTEPFEYLSETFNGYRVGWEDEINLDAIQIYFNECMRIIDEANGTGVLLIEDTIKLPEIHPLLKGTVDFGWWSSAGVKLRDYKNGEGIGVAAFRNRQLLYYGFLMIMSVPELRDGRRDLPVSLGIVQPNFYGIYEEPDVWETNVGEVLDWGNNELLPHMRYLSDRSRVELPTYDEHTPGEHCQFCPVMLECVKHREAFETYYSADEEFSFMLSNEEIDALYAKREQARRFMKTLETVVYARKVAGAEIKSAKLVEKQTQRVWKPGAEAAIKKAFGTQAYTPSKVLSPAALEKLSSQGKAMALEYGYKPESNSLVIAPLTDRRPEAKRKDNASIFAHVAAAAIEDF